MYESHFGFTGSPFQLNPDPSFYFDSRGHKNALAYLKFGAYQGEGFIVVTGEIGAGKTTLVRTLLEGLDQSTVAAAQVVSTQLESGDLLRAILSAFGVATSGESKAQLIATLEAFLTALAASGRRALLVVDEAQNLDRTAVEELRMLSNFQLGTHGLLQSFLVGQPELRAILQSKSMEQLRQRVIASCHLGPLDEGETRAYIEHRLRKVGWTVSPQFENEAFSQIYLWTGGIPRRINRLCNRLLLSAFLAEASSITAELVIQTAQELHAEIGDPGDVLATIPAAPLPSVSASQAAVAPPGVGALSPSRSKVQVVGRATNKPTAPLFCLIDTDSEYLMVCAIVQSMRKLGGIDEVVVVHTGNRDEFNFGPALAKVLPGPAVDIHLNCGHLSDARAVGDLLVNFDTTMVEYRPGGVLVIGKSEAALSCSLWAHRQGIPLARLRSGERRAWARGFRVTSDEIGERIAMELYTSDLDGYRALHRAGIPAERAHCVGDVLADAVQSTCGLLPDLAGVLAKSGLPELTSTNFALVAIRFVSGSTSSDQAQKLVSLLIQTSEQLPLVWMADAETLSELEVTRLQEMLVGTHLHVVRDLDYFERITLLQSARCLVADELGWMIDEAKAVGAVAMVVADTGMYRVDPVAGKDSIAVIDARHLPEVLRLAFKDGRGPCRAPIPAVEHPSDELAKQLNKWMPTSKGRARLASSATVDDGPAIAMLPEFHA